MKRYSVAFILTVAAALLLLGAVQKPDVLLISGFGPFPGVEVNPSWEAAKGFDGQVLGHYVVKTVQLPVLYDAAAAELEKAIDQFQPMIIVSFGVAPESDFRLETTARNMDDSETPDNGGTVRMRRAILRDGPIAYPSRLPIQTLLNSLQAQGIPVRVSDSAGSYVCNNLFYHLMDFVKGRMVLAGFVHVPTVPEEKGAERDKVLEKVSQGMRIILETLASGS